MKIDPNGPAMPIKDIGFNVELDKICTIDEHADFFVNYPGLTIRAELSARMPDTFRDLNISTQAAIHEHPPHYSVSENEIMTSFGTIEYARWLAIGSAKWKIMQADALIDELNK